MASDLDSDVLTAPHLYRDIAPPDSQVPGYKLSDAHLTIYQISAMFLLLKAEYNFPTQLSVGVADKFLGLIKYLPFQSFTEADCPS